MNTEEITGSLGGPSSRTRREREVEMLYVLADPVRLNILELLAAGERRACEIESYLDHDQWSSSLEFQVLKRAGIVDTRNDGTDVLYQLRNAHVLNLLRILDALITEQDEEELT